MNQLPNDNVIEILSSIKKEVKKFNFHGAVMISNDYTKMGFHFKDSESVFISEYLEYLFMNLKDSPGIYDLDDEKKLNLAEAIEDVLMLFEKFYAKRDESLKASLYNKMRDVRFLVSTIQIESFISDDKRVERRLMFR